MYNETIDLIHRIDYVDEYGDNQHLCEKRRVFVKVSSIGMKEFYEADVNGMKPELKLIIRDARDYCGEQELIYHGTDYHVLRTYQKGQNMELTVYREVI